MKIRLLEGNDLNQLEEIVNKELTYLKDNNIIDVRFKPVQNDRFIYYYAEILYK